MSDFTILEPAIDPNNRITFLLDWEVTMKCNLDCSYCKSGIYGGHDNTQPHPPLKECYESIEFMFEYADMYMATKPKGLRYVILNLYGGESLHHPGIESIIKRCRQQYHEKYKDKWNLTITTTTNAIISQKKMVKLIPLIDEFTCSYHSENSPKQKELFKTNVASIRDAGRRIKVVVLMHSKSELFDDTQTMIDWCESNGIKYLPRQLDHGQKSKEFNYNSKQVKWFGDLYKKKSYGVVGELKAVQVEDKFDLTMTGRACCGGRQFCKNGNRQQRDFFVPNRLYDWYCSVNEFFLYIKQVNGEIYVNKDCKMSFDGVVAPIGNLKNCQELLDWTRNNIDKNTMPVIQCKKSICFCGLCAPKAKSIEDFKSMIKIYRLSNE